MRSRSWVATARSCAARSQDCKLATGIASDRAECAQRQHKAWYRPKNAITYQDAVFGLVQVNETQHPNFDTISAKFVDGQTAASLGMQPGQTGTVGWNSDFGTNQSSTKSVHPLTGTLTYTINADGLGYTGQATYPAS